MKSMRIFMAACLMVGFGTAVAQEKEGSKGNENTHVPIIESLNALESKGEFVLKGSVRHQEAEDASGGFAQMIVIGGGGSGSGQSFTGPVEIWRTKDDEWLLVSSESLPGVGFYDNGERAITQVDYEDAPVGTADLTGDLSGLLDLHALKKALKKAEIEVKDGEEKGISLYRAKLSKRVVQRGGGSPFQIMAPQVLRVEAEFELKKSTLVRMTFTVVRSDPMADIKRRAMEGDLESGSQITEISMGATETSDEEGKSTLYTLRPAKGGPSDRAKKFRDHVHEVLKNEIF